MITKGIGGFFHQSLFHLYDRIGTEVTRSYKNRHLRRQSMKKGLVITALATAITFTSFGVPSIQPFSNPLEVSAATTSEYNNQEAIKSKARAITRTAKSLIGKATYAPVGGVNYSSYRFRCASFIHFVFKQNGVDLGTADENDMFQLGYPVSRDQLQKGDLVFFDSTPTNSDPTNHAGIYIGNNKIIHMANAKLDVTISDLDSTSYYRDNYVGARRVLPSLLSAK
jgi:cell wall-associated NlpC family hydrolase